MMEASLRGLLLVSHSLLSVHVWMCLLDHHHRLLFHIFVLHASIMRLDHGEVRQSVCQVELGQLASCRSKALL